MSINDKNTSIAVIGIGCYYPGAKNPKELWENVLARRQQFRRTPDKRLPIADYYDKNRLAPDKTYGKRMAVMDGFVFDWQAYKVAKRTYDSTDAVHWLALEIATQAISDAGYTREDIPRDTTGVIVGNTLTGELTRSNGIRLRAPYLKRTLYTGFWDLPQYVVDEMYKRMLRIYKSIFPPITEDTLAGALSNTIAGRICNYYDFHGGGYTVDGACSSSILAVITAARGLARGDMDLALAGGVDMSLDPFELVGFAKTSALTPGDMRVYDRRGNGFLPGEGCGFIVLKRLQDAIRDKNQIYAVIHGWGISSDGKGALTAPSNIGQATALKRAYETAGYSAGELDFVEGHGTGTKIGDKAEIEGIVFARKGPNNETPAPRSCGLTSFKTLVGHTKAAAGVGGLIKTIIAVNRRVLPPLAGCEQPHPVFSDIAQDLYPIMLGEIRAKDAKLRAGVSAMGFGGINSHVTVESYDPPSEKFCPDLDEKIALAHYQGNEVFPLAAKTPKDLAELAKNIASETMHLSVAEMADFGCDLAKKYAEDGPCRLAVVADNPENLTAKLEALAEEIPTYEKDNIKHKNTKDKLSWYGLAEEKKKLGYLFPGQGSQQLLMGRLLMERHAWARELVEQADGIGKEFGIESISSLIYRPLDRARDENQIEEWKKLLANTKVAQPAICLASVLYFKFLQKMGLEPGFVAGHSLGELTAFYAAGAFDEMALIRLAALRGHAMANASEKQGTMISLNCSLEKAEELVALVQDYAIIANFNSPTQFIVSGSMAGIDELENLATSQQILTKRLAVSNAFHSSFVADAARMVERDAKLPSLVEGGALKCKLATSIDGSLIDSQLNLVEHFSKQITSPVNFIALTKEMKKHCDYAVEVGPGHVLSGLVYQIDGPFAEEFCLPVASKTDYSLDLGSALGKAYCRGFKINWEELYIQRLIKPYVKFTEKIIFENPCEKPYDQKLLDEDRFGPEMNNKIIAACTPEGMVPQWQGVSGGSQNPDINAVFKHMHELLSGLETILTHGTGASGQTLPKQPSALRIVGSGEQEKKQDQDVQEATPVDAEIVEAKPGEEAVGIMNLVDVEKLLLERAMEITGFDAEAISLESRTYDDLNLDSIKTTELITSAAMAIGHDQGEDTEGAFDPSVFVNASLKEVAKILHEGTGSVGDKKVEMGTRHTLEDVQKVLIERIAEVTNFEPENIKLEAKMQDDLNLSQEALAKVITGTASKLGETGNIDIETFAEKTVAQTAETMYQIGVSRYKEAQKAKAQAAAASRKDQFVDISPWVREVVVDYVPEELTLRQPDWPLRKEDDWSKARVRIVYDSEEQDWAEAIKDAFYNQKAEVDLTTYEDLYAAGKNPLEAEPPPLPKGIGGPNEELEQPEGRPYTTHYIAILPQKPRDGKYATSRDRIEAMARRLRSIAVCPHSSKIPTRRTTVAYVQFGYGKYGSDMPPLNPETCSAAAFARSLHLERPDLRVRVIDLAPSLDQKWVAEKLPHELTGAAPCVTSGYTKDKERFVPKFSVNQPAYYKPRNLSWSEEDVILVTGGGKGITAECALVIGKETKATMVLVGSSEIKLDTTPEEDELKRNLLRFEKDGTRVRYYACDVNDTQKVKDLVEKVNNEVGRITGVIHGAGLNFPGRVNNVPLENAVKEVLPKLLGGMNLCEAMRDDPPKLFVAFTSVIGVSGTQGNTWYAFANDSLNLVMHRFKEENQRTEIQCNAYSIWDEVGMGKKMGSIEILRKFGVGTIPCQEGVERTKRLFFNHDPRHNQVVITAPLGGIDTWQGKPLERGHNYPFIEEVNLYVPEVELKARARLSLGRDLYVHDHNFNGSYVFPGVFGLEAMTEGVSLLMGGEKTQIKYIRDITFDRAILVNPFKGTEIEVRVEVLENTPDMNSDERVLKASVRAESTGFRLDSFTAKFFVQKRGECEIRVEIRSEENSLDLVPKRDLYGPYLFHGPIFQRMGRIRKIFQGEAIFDSYTNVGSVEGTDGFALVRPFNLKLGDPYHRDSMLQAPQIMNLKRVCLPVEIKEIEFFTNDPHQIGERLVNARFIAEVEKDELVSEVVSTDNQGKILEKISGYKVKVIQELPDAPSSEEITEPTSYDDKILRQTWHDALTAIDMRAPGFALAYLPGLHKLTDKDRHRSEEAVIERAVMDFYKKSEQKDEAIATEVIANEDVPELKYSVSWGANGKPRLKAKGFGKNSDLSLSHDETYCLCLVGENDQGCDIELVKERTREEWTAMLGIGLSPLLDILIAADDTLNQAGTRLWSAIETAKKASGESQFEISIKMKHEDIVLFNFLVEKLAYQIATFPVTFTRGPERMVAFTAYEKQVVEMIEDRRDPYRQPNDKLFRLGFKRDLYAITGEMFPRTFTLRFPVNSRHVSNLSRTLHYSNFAEWMGTVREMVLFPIAPQLVTLLSTGRWGMITNNIKTDIFGEARLNDIIEVRSWSHPLKGQEKSAMDLFFEWNKINDQGKEIIAFSEARMTWVEIMENGMIKPQPYPKFLENFLKKMHRPGSSDKGRPTEIKDRLAEQGILLFTNHGLAKAPVLTEMNFYPDLVEADGTGRVFFSHPSSWQGKLMDKFLYELIPDRFAGMAEKGEMVCCRSTMTYLREIRPFDKINVKMKFTSVHDNGLNVFFEYLKELPGNRQEKAGVGEFSTIWHELDISMKPQPTKLPQVIMDRIESLNGEVTKKVA